MAGFSEYGNESSSGIFSLTVELLSFQGLSSIELVC